MDWARQVLSFGAVGALATILHVTLAWMLISETTLNPYIANLLGTCTAFAISFLGNARFTFRTDRSLPDCARRYLLVSLLSLGMTSAILAFVESTGLPTYAYVLFVLGIVPPVTFLSAKLWAFQLVGRGGQLCPRRRGSGGAAAAALAD